ncbi:hypothetical protein ACQ5SK_26735 [Bradyrhizobium japonicum]
MSTLIKSIKGTDDSPTVVSSERSQPVGSVTMFKDKVADTTRGTAPPLQTGSWVKTPTTRTR